MDSSLSSRSLSKRAALACTVSALAAALAAATPAGAQVLEPVGMPSTPAPGSSSATLEQCVTSAVQTERSVTFAAEMTAVAGAARMSIRIDLEERAPGEAEFHGVNASGLGVWRTADPKVKVYKYLKQVSNLSSPASYRGFVRFRWLSARGHVIKRAERLTTRCLQPAIAPEATPPGSATQPQAGSSSAAGSATSTPVA